MNQTKTETYETDCLNDAVDYIAAVEALGWAVRQVVVHQAATQRCVCVMVVYERPGGGP